ncbi:MAG: ABC transporter permease [Candidatus Roizmanbacteria bacterium]
MTLFIIAGCGKTSFLNYLSGRDMQKELAKEGKVMVNGIEKENIKGYSSYSAYVQQDDILFQTMTVRECLEFSAKLKLKGELEEKLLRVDNLISELRLNKCQNTKIGGELIRGVSGGERKRTSIGVELITDPNLIFLDEPTTGLDSYTATSVIETLRDLTYSGKTVISTIHQPNSNIYQSFDRLMLMSMGKIIYFNEARLAVNYFSNLGFICPKLSNPADYFMHMMSIEEGTKAVVGEDRSIVAKSKEVVLEEQKAKIMEFHLQYEKSDLKNDFTYVSPEAKSLSDDDLEDNFVPWSYQFNLLLKRNVLNILRMPQTSYFKLLMILVTAIFTIVLFQGVEETLSGVQNRNGALFFITLTIALNSIQNIILMFPLERPVFLREVNNNMYKVSPYFFARILCELPMAIIVPTIFGSMTYFAIGFNTVYVWKFFMFCKLFNPQT